MCSSDLDDPGWVYDDATKTLTIIDLNGGWSASKDTVEHVIVVEGPTYINDTLFQSCTALKTVKLPSSLTQINTDAFAGCVNLVSVTMPNVRIIYERAFQNCSSLESLTLPGSLSILSGDVFNGCTSLNSITFGGTKAEWGKFADKVPSGVVVICTDGSVTTP